jgi:hypothetical protein
MPKPCWTNLQDQVIHPIDTLNKILRELESKLTREDASEQELNDRDLSAFPALFDKLYIILAEFSPTDKVVKAVSPVHITFLNALLAKRSFASMLVLAREANELLARSRTLSSSDPDALGPFLEWLSKHEVLQQLLAVNMHQRQYVDALQRLFSNLADCDGLNEKLLMELTTKLMQVQVPSLIASSSVMFSL